MWVPGWESNQEIFCQCAYWVEPRTYNARMSRIEKTYYVYIMASQLRVLYIGITSKIEIRVRQHKMHWFGGFTAKYNVVNLVYYERYSSAGKAIRREKELKSWRREKKIALIESLNPKWRDLSYGWYQQTRMHLQREPINS
jgi:putative endonuclease